MDLSKDFVATQQSVADELVATIRTSTSIAAHDLAFIRSSDPRLARDIDRQSARLLGLTQKLLVRAAASAATSKRLRLPKVEALDDRWRDIAEAAGDLFERADTCLDEFNGLIKPRQATAQSTSSELQASAERPRWSKNYRDAQIAKPQLNFESKPANHAKPPFRPLLTAKPNASVSLPDSLLLQPREDGTGQQYQHPYEQEIRDYTWPDQVLQKREPLLYRPFDSTTATFVDTFEEVQEMLSELRSADVIAVDLEHHDTHSYIGLVSLMQISTRDHDWIVDTLKPWRQRLEILNEVFTNPRILKVFHGAYMDVIWLQRDLGLYLVGLFDTFHACRSLHYQGASLAFLLKKFVNFDAQKQYQTADWRMRPLPPEMFEYARSDTHFLLYIFECVRNELITTERLELDEGLGDILHRCKETALQRYEYSSPTDDIGSRHNGWAALLIKSPTVFTSEEVSVFSSIYRWRDAVAREEDEGTNYVLPNHALFSLTKAAPKNSAEAVAAVHGVSPILRQRAGELVAIIDKAGKEGGAGPDSQAVFNKFPARPHRSQNRPVVEQQARAVESAATTPLFKPAQPGEHALRVTDSSFWGSALVESSLASMGDLEKGNTPFSIVPALVVGSLTNTTSPLQSATPHAPAEGALKRKVSSPNPTSRSPDEMSDDAALQHVESRAERKSRKKKRARGGKDALTTADISESAVSSGQQGFDYESAPSVLRPARPPTGSVSSSSKKKPYNPYVKAEAAATGMKRSQEPSAGRSLTYK